MSNRFTWMHSGQIGAPQMNGAAGSNGQMLQVLDGCLINGFNARTVVSVNKTAASVTLTYGLPHGYAEKQIVLVSGADDALLNGRHRVISKTESTITIDAKSVVNLTGTIITKVAPLGWESIFGSADPLKRAYRSNNVQSSKTVLYLDMTLPTGHGYHTSSPAKRATVSMCEDMTTLGVQINSYTDARNDFAKNVNGALFWHQARGRLKNESVTKSNNIDWLIFGDGLIFYIFTEWRTYGVASSIFRDFYAFGEAASLDGSVNLNNCVWAGFISDDDSATVMYSYIGAQVGGTPSTASDVKGYFIKNFDGTGSLDPFVISDNGTYNKWVSGRNGAISNFPNPATQSLIGLPSYALANENLRAEIPSLLIVPQNLNTSIDYDKLVMGDSVLVAVHGGGNSAVTGYFAVRVAG